MRKVLIKILYMCILFCLLAVLGVWFLLARRTGPDLRFVSETNSLRSPSGQFIAKQEDLLGDHAGYFVIHIFDQSGKRVHSCESLFRQRDSNFILWADEEDVLWGYNGDIGTSCWVLEDDGWVQYGGPSLGDDFAEDGIYIGDNPNSIFHESPCRRVDVPQALMDIRPRRFPVKTITVYAYDGGYRKHFYTVYPTPER